MLRKLLSTLGILIGTVLLVLFIIGMFFEKQVGELFIRELNKSLVTDLRVDKFDLSMIADFPEASLVLKNVTLPGALRGSGTLLKADNLSLRFGAMGVFSGQYNIKTVDITGGAMHVVIDKNGKASYDIFKDTGKTSDGSSDFQLSLENASLKDVELIYIDEVTQQEMAIHVKQASASGEFSDDKFKLLSKAELFSGYIELEGEQYLTGKDVSYDADIDVDLKNGSYKFREVVVEVDKTNSFDIGGLIETKGKDTDYDLLIKGQDCSLSSVLDLLPPSYERSLGDFESKGTFLFNATIKGSYNANKTPTVNIKFGLQDGKITNPRLDYDLRDADFTANFITGSNVKSYFEIPDFKGVLHGENIEFDLLASNLDDPNIRFRFNGNIPMDAVHGFINVPGLKDGDGLFEIEQLEVSGKYKDMIDPYGISRVRANAKMNFNDFEIDLNGEDISIEDGSLVLQGNQLSVKETNITAPGTDLVISGTFTNIIPVLFADSANTKKALLKFDAQLTGSQLDLDELMALTQIDVEEGDVPEAVYDSLKQVDVEQNESLFTLLDGTFQANIDQLNYNKINAKNIKGKLILGKGKLKIRDVTVDAMKGNFQMGGDVTFDEKPNLTAKIYCKGIDARQFFYQTESFGQEYLTDKHVRGDLDAKIKINAYWNEKGDFLYDKLYTLADVELTSGELVGFEMLEDFSKYIKLQDLKKVKFSKTENQFAIKKGVFYIPTMYIQTNAANLTLSGRHTMEDEMDYLIKVNAGQVLMNKFKKFNPSRKPKRAKKKGLFNIYVNVIGTLDDYEFKYSKKDYNKTLQAGLEREYAKIRREVSQEFSVDALYEPDDALDEGESSTGNTYSTPSTANPTLGKGKAAKPEDQETSSIQSKIPDEAYDPELDVEIDF